MLNTRYAPLAFALVAAALAGPAAAAQSEEMKKDQPAAEQSTPQAPAPAAKEDGKPGNGATSAAVAAQPQQPVAKAPAQRRVVTTREIEEANRYYPGG